VYVRDDDDAQLAVDVGAESRREPAEAAARCLCPHQHAFAVLTALALAWRCDGDPRRALRASAMRLLLPLEEPLRTRVQRELRRLADLAGERHLER
jgi:hypothetical protein